MMTRKGFLRALFLVPFAAKPALKAATQLTSQVTGSGSQLKIGDTVTIRKPQPFRGICGLQIESDYDNTHTYKIIQAVHSETLNVIKSNLQFHPNCFTTYFKPQPVQLQLLTDEEMDEYGYRNKEDDEY